MVYMRIPSHLVSRQSWGHPGVALGARVGVGQSPILGRVGEVRRERAWMVAFLVGVRFNTEALLWWHILLIVNIVWLARTLTIRAWLPAKFKREYARQIVVVSLGIFCTFRTKRDVIDILQAAMKSIQFLRIKEINSPNKTTLKTLLTENCFFSCPSFPVLVDCEINCFRSVDGKMAPSWLKGWPSIHL